MSTHYAFEVLRAEINCSGFSTSVSWAKKLYVKVGLGDRQQKTGLRNLQVGVTPAWNETLALSSDDKSKNETLLVELKQRLCLGRSRCLGSIETSLTDLMSKSANGEVPLSLHHPVAKSGSSTTSGGVLYVRLRAIDADDKTGIQITNAVQRVEQSGMIENASSSSEKLDTVDKGIVLAGSFLNMDGSLEKIMSGIDAFATLIDKISTIHPFLNAAWQVTSSLYKAVRNQQDVDKRFIHLVQMMSFIFDVICGVDFVREKVKTLEETIRQFLQQSAECCLFIHHYIDHGFVGRMMDQTNLQKIKDFTEGFRDLRAALDSGVALRTAFVSSRVAKEVEVVYLRNELNPPDMNASNRKHCLDGTRTEILKNIMGWLFSDTEENILWLRGVAGSGKSTISMTISEYCQEVCRCGAYLFFEREKSDPSSVIRALAYSLARFEPSISKHVSDAVSKHRGIGESRLALQFKKLISEPLVAASADLIQGPVIIILDALDECGGASETRGELLSLIANDFVRLPNAFRFLITSRPEKDINQKLSSPSSRVRAMDLDISSESSLADVSLYIRTEMKNIFEGEDMKLMSDWDQSVTVLSDAANGLFVWASTAIKMVSTSVDPFVDLENLVFSCRSSSHHTGSHQEMEFGLNGLYSAVLQNAGIRWDHHESKSRFTRVLSLILFGKTPLSVTAIDGLLGFPQRSSSRFIIERLQSVLVYTPGNPDAPVRVFHASFSDYLTAPERSKDPWYIDVALQRHFIATRCFKVMQEGLRFNICGVQSSYLRNKDVPDIEKRLKESISPSLDYACCFWSAHLCDVPTSDASHELKNNLVTFANRSLLYWMEVLGLTERFWGVYSRALMDATSWSAENASNVSSLLRDAHRFATTFAIPISVSVPHIYLSALSFTTDESTMHEYHSTRYPVVRMSTFGSRVPQSHTKTFEGHTNYVTSVAFSPDGKRVVSGSYDKTIRVWDSESGALVVGPLEGHAHYVTSVAFSFNGKLIVSGSYDKTIRVWDSESGELVAGPFEGHAKPVASVAISSDGKRIASGSDDKTIRVWDSESGALVVGPLEGHAHYVTSVAFSFNGKRVVSSSTDKTVRVWDAKNGALVAGPFKGHTESVASVAVSADGKRVVSGSWDRTIRVWDTESGELVAGPFEGHTACVNSVAISADEKRVVSGSWDKTIRMWDLKSGEPAASPLEGHTYYVTSVAISANGRRIVSGSWDKTIRMWDSESKKLDTGPFEGHAEPVVSVAISADGKRVVSGSWDKTVRVWDSNSAALVAAPFQGHTHYVSSVVFSPEGKRVVSGSYDKTIRVWDSESGTLVAGPFEGHTHHVNSVAISSDGKRIASGSWDRTIRVWDAKSEALVGGPLEGHTGIVWSVAFSPNGKRVVSGSGDKTIRVWDSESGVLVAGPLEGHTHCVRSVAVSPNGKCIVSGSDDKTIRVWDLENGTLVAGPFEGHTEPVASVAVSSDGKHVVSGSWDKTIRVWDTESGQLVAGPFEGHSEPMRSVAFSADGKRIVSGSWDKTIRLWSAEGEPSSVRLPCEASSCCDLARYCSDSMRDLLAELGISASWITSHDGWLLGRNGELLLWVPPDVRPTLWQPSNVAIFSCRFFTVLDFTNCRVGSGWHEGFPLS